MQIVFLNTFEKPGDDQQVISSQLSICEQQGVWSVLWMEADGEVDNPETWFEGTSWEEMITSFRHGVAKVMGEGYKPIIDGMLDERSSTEGSFRSKLQCYGELYADEELFQKLRMWRRAKASEEKRSAYLIATNRMLWMISAFVPRTSEELAQIPGWGAAKQAAYGTDLLELMGSQDRKTDFPLQWVNDQLDSTDYNQWLFKQKEAKYKLLLDRQQVKKRLLASAQQAGTLAQLESELELSRRELLERMEQLEEEGYDFDALITRELIDMPEEEKQLVWDALTAVGDKYLKPVLQKVYGTTEPSQLSEPVDVLYERLRLIRLRFRRSQMTQAG